MHDLVVDLSAVAICGALGGFVNVFIGDSGLHLPEIEDGIFRPGYIGVVFVGAAAALGAWLATQGASLVDSLHSSTAVTLRLSELNTAIVVGFGGARWFKSEGRQRCCARRRRLLQLDRRTRQRRRRLRLRRRLKRWPRRRRCLNDLLVQRFGRAAV